MSKKRFACLAGTVVLSSLVGALTARGEEGAVAPKTWDEWANSSGKDSMQPVVQNRQIEKAGRFQLIGPLAGISNRQDFYTTYILSLAGRYHFTETSAWEFLQLDFTFPSPTGLATEIQSQTSFVPDVQISHFQIGTAYVYTPIYGKYAWNSDSIVYFDIFGTAGLGVRFANDRQPFVELGVGMNHYIWARRLALVPEIRWRFYSEQRSQSTFVAEGLLQLGVSWLF